MADRNVAALPVVAWKASRTHPSVSGSGSRGFEPKLVDLMQSNEAYRTDGIVTETGDIHALSLPFEKGQRGRHRYLGV